MIRDAQYVYRNQEKTERPKKESDGIKQELHHIHDQMLWITNDHTWCPRDLTASQQKDFWQLQEDFQFWSQEMSRQQRTQHRFRKKCRKKCTAEFLRDYVKREISAAKANGRHYICKDNIQIRLGCRQSDLDKVFMQLNREGVLSQAVHSFLHDSRRISGVPILSTDYTRNTDWASDLYQILI